MSSILTRRLNYRAIKNAFRNFSTSSSKLGGEPPWVYRRPPLPPPANIIRRAEIIGALMWYWIIYHCITQYEHITGEFEYPDVKSWTDKELGIPPDDEE